MKVEVISNLTDKNDAYACAIADEIISESQETDKWYEYFDEFASLVDHPKSYVRNRAFHILAANAQWDDAGRFDSVIPQLLNHITDEKPISARQCIQALAIIGSEKPQYVPAILTRLNSADISNYKESMRELIEKDIASAVDALSSIEV